MINFRTCLCYSERESMVDYIKEQENLTRQLHLLQYVMSYVTSAICLSSYPKQIIHKILVNDLIFSDSNRKLHDTNDDLRSALESHRPQKRTYIGVSSTVYRSVTPFQLNSIWNKNCKYK